MKRFFIISVFIFIAAIFANAQQLPPSYLYLEVVDSNDKPVSGATVNNSVVQTDKQGQAKLSYYCCDKKPFAHEFSIFKSGYFPFQDLGILPPHSSRGRSAKIELLKIPNTEAERAALGDEQIKREFFNAIQNADVPAIRKLLNSGISPNITVNELRGFSSLKSVPAIVYAAAAGDGETVKTLLQAGANARVDSNSYVGSILVFYLRADPFARRKPETDEEKARLMREYTDGLRELIKFGANINANINIGDYKLSDYAGGMPLIYAVMKGYTEPVKILIDSGARVSDSRFEEVKPLIVAARGKNIEIARLLIEKGVSLDAQDKDGRTALMHTVLFGSESQIEMAKLLIEAGADANIIADKSWYYILQNCQTALMLAVVSNNLPMTEFLINHKANVNIACSNGDTALKYAKQERSYGFENQEIIKILEAAGAK